ncbi:hypothetical protein COJ96_10910 [Bacillus sp. AFS073361]|uniref:putative minor capsid protein n=1 Tax=Bacillus sp. AFS073361 TaxID=2033511 RepID=UPI000BF3DA7E|nr:putative minor capsid protein [Bacillus sp. AFS073361]PFP29406.1 hypothetical protein COJ96_10910 [Bacillus sp. AFS073361]
MRISHLLIHCATVVVPGGQSGKDAYGRPIYSEPTTREIKCRLDQLRQSTSTDDEGKDVLWSYILFAGPEDSFDMNMQIREVVDKEGNVVAKGTYSIEQIFPVYQLSRLHHYELHLSRGDGAIV